MTTAVDRWEAREQREWEIGAMVRSREKRAGADPTNLRDALESTRPITLAGLRELASRPYRQPVVSAYLNLSPQRVGDRPRAYLSVFKSLRRRELEARQDLLDRLSRRQRAQLTDDLDEIERVLGALVLDGTRSLVVLKSGDDLNRVIRLPVGTVDSVTIDLDPYVAPLEAMLEEQRPVLVVEVDKHESRFWSFHLHHLERMESLDAMEPTGDVRAAERPSKDQRRRFTHLQWHLKATARLASRLVEERRFGLLALAGDDIVLAELQRFLPERLAPLVVELHPSPHEDGDAWRRQLERVLAGRRRAEEETALERLDEYRARGVLVTGLPGVLEVVNRFLVRRLFISVDTAEPGHVCRQHHFFSLEAGDCPFCGAELLPTENVMDELIEFARLHGVELMVVDRAPELLAPHGGVAAVTYELDASQAPGS